MKSDAKFSNRVKDVIAFSREEALRLGHEYIGAEHLLLGMIREGEGIAVAILQKLGIVLDELKISIERATKSTATGNVKNLAQIPLTKQAEKVLKITYLEARISRSELIGTEHLLLSILRDPDNLATQILQRFDINYETVKETLEFDVSRPAKDSGFESPRASGDTDDNDDDRGASFGPPSGGKEGIKPGKIPHTCAG